MSLLFSLSRFLAGFSKRNNVSFSVCQTVPSLCPRAPSLNYSELTPGKSQTRLRPTWVIIAGALHLPVVEKLCGVDNVYW